MTTDSLKEYDLTKRAKDFSHMSEPCVGPCRMIANDGLEDGSNALLYVCRLTDWLTGKQAGTLEMRTRFFYVLKFFKYVIGCVRACACMCMPEFSHLPLITIRRSTNSGFLLTVLCVVSFFFTFHFSMCVKCKRPCFGCYALFANTLWAEYIHWHCHWGIRCVCFVVSVFCLFVITNSCVIHTACEWFWVSECERIPKWRTNIVTHKCVTDCNMCHDCAIESAQKYLSMCEYDSCVSKTLRKNSVLETETKHENNSRAFRLLIIHWNVV